MVIIKVIVSLDQYQMADKIMQKERDTVDLFVNEQIYLSNDRESVELKLYKKGTADEINMPICIISDLDTSNLIETKIRYNREMLEFTLKHTILDLSIDGSMGSYIIGMGSIMEIIYAGDPDLFLEHWYAPKISPKDIMKGEAKDISKTYSYKEWVKLKEEEATKSLYKDKTINKLFNH